MKTLLCSTACIAAVATGVSASEYDLRYADAFASAVGGDEGEVYTLGASGAYERNQTTLGGSFFYLTDDDGDYSYGLLGYGAYEFPSAAIGYGGVLILGDDFGQDTLGFVGGQFPVGAGWDAGATVIFDADSQNYLLFAGTDIGTDGYALGVVSFGDDTSDTTFIGQLDWTQGATDYGVLASFDDDDFFGVIANMEREFGGSFSQGRPMRYGLSGTFIDFGGGDETILVSASLGVELQDNVWLDASLGYGEEDGDDSVIWSLGIDFELGRRGQTYQRVQDIEFTGFDFAF